MLFSLICSPASASFGQYWGNGLEIGQNGLGGRFCESGGQLGPEGASAAGEFTRHVPGMYPASGHRKTSMLAKGIVVTNSMDFDGVWSR